DIAGMVCRLTSLPTDGDGPGHHGPIRLVYKPAENCITVLCDRRDGLSICGGSSDITTHFLSSV
ncbi:MAG: hypothetical protein QOD02_6132, partial [Mycobacterium sp.]|nr:hypothetical protein [Mycobacterium sp.]